MDSRLRSGTTSPIFDCKYMKYILGKKLGMSQIFDKDNKVIPVTLIEAGPCFVIQAKTEEKDGYQALQIGFEEKKKAKKTDKGYRYLREFEGEGKVGDKIDVSIFEEGEKVWVVGTSKGKGFQGVVKRHGFHGGPASHGQKHTERAPGSIGSAFPERVFKGKKMAGRMGSDRTTTKGLKVAQIDKENNLIAIKGAVAGRIGGLVEVKVL